MDWKCVPFTNSVSSVLLASQCAVVSGHLERMFYFCWATIDRGEREVVNETPCQRWQEKRCSCRAGRGARGAAPAFALLRGLQSFPLVTLVFSLCIHGGV